METTRKLDVIADHPAIAARTRLLETEPDLERAETAGILRTVLVVILHFLAFIVVELVVRRLRAEGVVQIIAFAHQSTSSLERRVQPFVRIDGDRVGEAQPLEISAGIIERDGRRSVGAVDVEPEIKFLADLRNFVERIDGSGSD